MARRRRTRRSRGRGSSGYYTVPRIVRYNPRTRTYVVLERQPNGRMKIIGNFKRYEEAATMASAGKGMFYRPAHHKYLAEIITFKSVSAAEDAARRLKQLYKEAKTRDKRLTILRAVVLAANRAKVAARRHPYLKPSTRERLLKVARVYRKLADELKADYRRRYYGL